MRSKRVPDRVHVVRPPEQTTDSGIGSTEVIRMLAQISDKLKRSEAERYELLNELREYRKSLRDLEDKTENSEKAYLALENKISTKGSVDAETLQRQARFEKTLRATEEKMVKAIAGQAIIDKRLQETEEKQLMIDQRLDQSVTEQARLDRQLELTAQDKSRLLRKVERLEEIVTETQDTLRAKAMVLLTDQSASANAAALKAPAWATKGDSEDHKEQNNQSFWQRMITKQNLSMGALVIAALLAGWAINQAQKPDLPQITVLEDGNLAKLNKDNNRWEALNAEGADATATSVKPAAGTQEQVQSQEASLTNSEAAPENVLDLNDDQLMEALNNDPEGLAAQLNNIEPQVGDAAQNTTPAQDESAVISSAMPAVLNDPQITQPMKDFEKLAFVQDAKIKNAVASEKQAGPLSSRIKPDASLPRAVKDIEVQAFKGNAEAQHDLAAIYTAGHGGVDQNFEKAGFWFREASDNGIANARYNLGVLYHQGLGKERDLGRALYWYREAAKLDHAEAQYNLGIAHIEGIGTNYDPRLAAAFFERAANNGIMEAAYNLGLIYENGLLGEAKPDEALLWYKIAADQGSPDAKSAMEQLAKNLQIGMDDVDKLVERMQQINQSVKGRRAGPAKASGSKTSSINSEQAITAQIQEYLMLTGAYAGPADGVNGPQTEQAIRDYQQANNMPVDGQISQALLNNMVSGAIEKLNAAE